MTTKGRHIIALSLVVVFSLNTMISTACAASSLFHTFHHHEVSDEQVTHHSHEHDGSHEHTDQQEKSKEDCCAKSVVQFYQLDKYVSQALSLPLVHVIFSSFIYTPGVIIPGTGISHQPLTDHNRRWRHSATIPDLRIVIQSFQI